MLHGWLTLVHNNRPQNSSVHLNTHEYTTDLFKLDPKMERIQLLDFISSASSRILNVSSARRNELPLYSKRKSQEDDSKVVI